MMIRFAIILLFATICAAQPKLEVMDINLKNVEYPFPVKIRTFNIQGQSLRMAYMDVRPKNPNNKTVILLHGKNFAGNYWEQTARDLTNEGFRVIIPDQIGFGKSSKPTHIQYSFQLLAENTKTILDELKIRKASVIGHSMGGMLAVRFALMYPDFTEKVILVNPIGLEDWKRVVPYQSVDDWYQSELKQDYEHIRTYQMEYYYANNWKPEYDKWLNQLAGWTINKDYPVIAKNSALLYDMIFTQPVFYEFENVKPPVMLIIGQKDRTAIGKGKAPIEIQETLGNYPSLGKAAAARFKKGELIEIPEAGHMPHIQTYSEFITPTLEFLKRK